MDEDRYNITSVIAKGRSEGSYQADDTVLNRTVSVQRFFVNDTDRPDEHWENQFHTFIQILRDLQHPGLPEILEADIDEDGAYLITPFLEGQRLQEQISTVAFDESAIKSMATQLLSVLATAHASSIVHGSLSPNFIFTKPVSDDENHYTIIDLGLSHLVAIVQGSHAPLSLNEDPTLIAPEMFGDDGWADERSDCYVLGHILYLCLAGGHPFAGRDFDTTEFLHRTNSLPPLTNYRTDLSPDFLAWLKKLTEAAPTSRFNNAIEAMEALQNCAPPVAEKTFIAEKTEQLIRLITAPQTIKPVSSDSPTSPDSSDSPTAPTTPTTPTTPTAPVFQTTSTAPTAPISQKPQITQEPLETNSPKKNNQKGVMATIIASAALIIIAFFLAQPEEEAPDQEAPPRINITPAKKPEPSIISTLLYSCPPDQSVRKGCDLSPEHTNDWVVYQGTPLSEQTARHPSGEIIRNTSLIGNFSQHTYPLENFIFFQKDAPALKPGLLAASQDCDTTDNRGWKIELCTPSLATAETLRIYTHFTTWNCDASLRFTRKDGTLINTAEHYTSSTENTSFGTHSELSGLATGETFFLEIIAKEAKSDKGIALSLNGINTQIISARKPSPLAEATLLR